MLAKNDDRWCQRSGMGREKDSADWLTSGLVSALRGELLARLWCIDEGVFWEQESSDSLREAIGHL